MHIRKQIYYNHSSREDYYYYYYFLQISKQSRYFNIKILRYILLFFFLPKQPVYILEHLSDLTNPLQTEQAQQEIYFCKN